MKLNSIKLHEIIEGISKKASQNKDVTRDPLQNGNTVTKDSTVTQTITKSLQNGSNETADDNDDVLSIFNDNDDLFGDEANDLASASSKRIPHLATQKKCQKNSKLPQEQTGRQQSACVEVPIFSRIPLSAIRLLSDNPSDQSLTKPAADQLPSGSKRHEKDPRKRKHNETVKFSHNSAQKENIATKRSGETEQTKEKPAIPNSANIQPSSLFAICLPSFVNNPSSDEPAFHLLFLNVCRPFMNNKCTGDCRFSHELPDHARFNQLLAQLSQKDVLQTYNVFILRMKKLCLKYFIDFCEYFGDHSLETSLIQMINDCEDQGEYKFFPQIIKNLIKIGNSYDVALRKIISVLRHRNNKANDAIINLTLDERNLDIEPFCDLLYELAIQDNYMYPIECINRLMTLLIEKKHSKLYLIISTVISKLDSANMLKLNSALVEETYNFIKHYINEQFQSEQSQSK